MIIKNYCISVQQLDEIATYVLPEGAFSVLNWIVVVVFTTTGFETLSLAES